jgi:hypothetical protein
MTNIKVTRKEVLVWAESLTDKELVATYEQCQRKIKPGINCSAGQLPWLATRAAVVIEGMERGIELGSESFRSYVAVPSWYYVTK